MEDDEIDGHGSIDHEIGDPENETAIDIEGEEYVVNKMEESLL